ncbi:MAG: hypothetical protein AB2552_21000 [Candidatus Thiodiazotropha endolucinida]
MLIIISARLVGNVLEEFELTNSHLSLQESQEWLWYFVPDPETLFDWRKPVERQLIKSGIDWHDVLYVLRNPSGLYRDYANDGRTFRVAGTTLDGITISVICVIYEQQQRIKFLKVWQD